MTNLEGVAPLSEPLRHSVAASERERRRWAREFHDETLQRLGAMRLRLAAAHRGPAAALGPAVEDTISELALEIAELRSLIAELSPVALEELGLEAALESLAHHHRVAHGLDVTVDLSGWGDRGRPVRLDPELESTLYRAAEEALANVASHARASAAKLRLRRSATEVELTVSDDGAGFDPRAGTGELGLTVLGERLALVDGVLLIDSSPGAGTKLSARVPV
jgi:two-component system, NarL family, sensor histidine kinase DevS